MPGVVFVIVVPTANFEQEILNGIQFHLDFLLKKHTIRIRSSSMINFFVVVLCFAYAFAL